MHPPRFFLFLLLSGVLGCNGTSGPSENEVQRQFSVELELANDCEADAQCTVIYPGCPLGCNAAVHIDKAAHIEEVADKLRGSIQSDGQSCQYSCVAANPACIENKCTAVF